MANSHTIGPDHNPNESGPYDYYSDDEYRRAWAAAIVLVLLMLGGIAMLVYGNETARITTLTDITTGQSTRPAPSQPLVPLYQHP